MFSIVTREIVPAIFWIVLSCRVAVTVNSSIRWISCAPELQVKATATKAERFNVNLEIFLENWCVLQRIVQTLKKSGWLPQE